MNLLTTLFCYEWIQLKRNRLMLGMLIGLSLCAGYAVHYGYSSIRRQLSTIALIGHVNDSTKMAFYRYFDDPKTADSVRFGWAGMNSLYDGFTTEEFLDNNVAVNLPNQFSHLSIGQRDIYPVYRRVTARSLYYDGSGISLEDQYAETSNPHKLLAGNFDLSFVLLYVFPLLIIAFCYNVLSEEKETGSYPFLRNLPVPLHRIILVKFLFRFCVVGGLATLYAAVGYALSPVDEPFAVAAFLKWEGLMIGYLLLWFMLAGGVVALRLDSPVSALSLVGCWMLLLVVIPASINNYIAATHKITSRTALVEQLNRLVSSIWELPDSITVTAYYRDYPQYAETPFKPLWTAADSYDILGKDEEMDSRYNRKTLVWHYYLDKQIQKPLAAYQQQILAKQRAADPFLWINPAVAVQEGFNELAASGYCHQQRYRMATAAYRDSIFSLTNRYVFERRKLSLDDYKGYPAFDLEIFSPLDGP